MAALAALPSVAALAARVEKLKELTKPTGGPEVVPSGWAASATLTERTKTLIAAATAASNCATKMAIVLKNKAGAGDPTASASICEEMGHACEHMATCLTMAVEAGSGSPLRFELCRVIHMVLIAVIEVTETVERKGPASPDVNRATGVVWSSCEGVAGVPKSNKIAYRRVLMKASVEAKDTIDEFTELVAESKEGDGDGEEGEGGLGGGVGAASGGGGLDDPLDDGFGEDDDEKYVGAGEIAAAETCVNTFKLLRATYKLALDGMSKVGDSENKEAPDPDEMAWIARLCHLCEEASSAATDLGAAMYPSLDTDLDGELQQVRRGQRGRELDGEGCREGSATHRRLDPATTTTGRQSTKPTPEPSSQNTPTSTILHRPSTPSRPVHDQDGHGHGAAGRAHWRHPGARPDRGDGAGGRPVERPDRQDEGQVRRGELSWGPALAP